MRFVLRVVNVTVLLLAFAALPGVAPVGVSPIGVSPAWAQIDSREGIALQNQIYQLRQQLQTLQQNQGGGQYRPAPNYAPPPQQYGGGGNDMVAQLLTRVDALDDQVRQLRGRIDETQNQVQQMNQELNKKIDDLAFQMGQGQPSRAAPPQPSPQAYAPPPSPAREAAREAAARPAGPRTPETTLQEGNAALARRDYASAEAAAREVLANRTSPRAYDAKLLLAQALYGQRQYPQAAVAFDDAYNASRKGSHAQDALLGLANSLSAIKENKAACDTLGRLRNDYPQLRPDIRDGATAVAQKASCR